MLDRPAPIKDIIVGHFNYMRRYVWVEFMWGRTPGTVPEEFEDRWHTANNARGEGHTGIATMYEYRKTAPRQGLGGPKGLGARDALPFHLSAYDALHRGHRFRPRAHD